MNIGIDARMLGQGFGLARYLQQLVLHLEKLDTRNEYVIFMRKNNWHEYEPSNPKFRKVEADISWYTFEEQKQMPAHIRAEKVDLMHFPHWNVPITYNDPFVVTIHDLTMYHFPRPEATALGPLKFWLKDRAHRLAIHHAVKKAAHIFVTTEFTRQDVHEHLSVPLERMQVTYQAPFVEVRTEISVEAVTQKYELGRPYVLYVGAAYPHKNLSGLVAAWKRFHERYDEKDTYDLVLAGKPDYFYDRLQKEQARYIGFVPDEELSALYTGASLFVFPSLYEGFGLPPLEAMQHGVPIVSSNRSCLPEVLGEGALYIDPENSEQFAEAIHSVLTDKDLRAQLQVQGKEELRRFSWETLAAETLAGYKAVGYTPA